MLNLLTDGQAVSAVDFSTIDTGTLVATITAGLVFGFGITMLIVPIKKAYGMAKKAIKGA